MRRTETSSVRILSERVPEAFRYGSYAGKPAPILTAEDIARLWSKIRVGSANECWPWMGGRSSQGYGRFKVGGKLHSPYRLVVALRDGGLPLGVVVLHGCDNPSCCNPAHLTAGSQRDNVLDMIVKGRENRERGVDRAAAKLNDEQVRAIRDSRRSKRSLAAVYGVAHSVIGAIKTRRAWRHVL